MTIPHITGTVPQEDTRKQYFGNGIEANFIYPYFIPDDIDINVYVTPAGNQSSEALDIKILNVDYTVQNAGNNLGGTITFIPASIPGISSIVTLVRDVKDTITTNYDDAQTITGSNLDESFEREMLVIQQNKNNSEQRSLRYQDSAFLPASETRNILPTLAPNFLWKGSASGGVIAVEDKEEAGCSSLRSELANNASGTDGAGLVGWFNIVKGLATTVRDQLNLISSKVFGADGAREVGYYDPINLTETTVGDQLDLVTGETDGLPEKLQNNFAVYGDDVGTADVIVVNVTPAYQSYIAGTKVFVKVAFTNLTTTPTINLNGLGPKLIINNNKSSMLPSDLTDSGVYGLIYDGTDFQLITSTESKSISFSQPAQLVYNQSGNYNSLLSNVVGSKVIPENSVRQGTYYRFIFSGRRNAISSSQLRLLSNGVTLAQFDTGTNINEFSYEIDLIIRNTGSPSTIAVELKEVYFTSGGNVESIIRRRIINSVDFDTSVDNLIDVQAQLVDSPPAIPNITTESSGVIQVY